MKAPYLEVTFLHGRPFAGYLYLTRKPGDKSARTQRVEPGLVVDFSVDGRPIGIEITAPALLTEAAVNQVLRGLEIAPLEPEDLAPLLAA